MHISKLHFHTFFVNDVFINVYNIELPSFVMQGIVGSCFQCMIVVVVVVVVQLSSNNGQSGIIRYFM